MGNYSSRVKIGSLWQFKHASPKLVVKVFEVNKVYTEEKLGKTVRRAAHTEIIFGLRSSNGHICQTLEGFRNDYTLVKNA